MTDEAAARVIVGGDQDFTLEGWVRTVQGGPLVAKAAADPPEVRASQQTLFFAFHVGVAPSHPQLLALTL